MAGLISHTSFIEHMDKLTSTQDSIQSTSSWFQWGRGNVKEMVEWWEEYFRNASQEKRLSMIYLANDVLQNSRRKGPDFVIEFYKVLPKAFDLFISKADPKSRQRAERVLKIWEERKVFGRNSSKFRESMKSTGNNGSSTRAKTGIPERSARSSGSHDEPNIPAIAKEIVNGLKKAEEMTLNREKITKSFENLNTASGLSAPEQREALRSMLQNCILALEKELESRQNAIVSLEEALQNQRNIEAMIASSLSDCRIQLAACENPATDGGNSQDQEAHFGQTSPRSTAQPPTAESHMNGEEVNVTEAEASALAEQLLSDPSALSMFQEALMATGAQTNEEYTPEETFN